MKNETIGVLRYYVAQWSRIIRANALIWRKYGETEDGVEAVEKARTGVEARNRLRAEIKRREKLAADEAAGIWRFKLTVLETKDGVELVVERKGR